MARVLCAAVLVLSLAGGAFAADRPGLIEIVPANAVNTLEMICPCEFDLGRQIDGETLLIVDHNGSDQAAFARIDGSLARLPAVTRFQFR